MTIVTVGLEIPPSAAIFLLVFEGWFFWFLLDRDMESLGQIRVCLLSEQRYPDNKTWKDGPKRVRVRAALPSVRSSPAAQREAQAGIGAGESQRGVDSVLCTAGLSNRPQIDGFPFCLPATRSEKRYPQDTPTCPL